MEPLLLLGYTAIFVLLFAYVVRLQRRLAQLRRRVDDLDG
jgi:CcmD family protein